MGIDFHASIARNAALFKFQCSGEWMLTVKVRLKAVEYIPGRAICVIFFFFFFFVLFCFVFFLPAKTWLIIYLYNCNNDMNACNVVSY